jgi:S-formylglutathione hydrolase FrmB
MLAALAMVAAFVTFRSVPASALGPGDLTLVSQTPVTARSIDLTFTTPALKAQTKARVVLPAGYDPSSSVRYPMIMMLHGGAGQYTDWATGGEIERLTEGLPVIVLLPDGLKSAWYTDWYNNGLGGPPALETYHIDQLLPWVDAHFPTRGDRSGRAIAGLSSGGFGAMSYATRHPDLFAAAAGFSGALDTNTPYGLSPAVIDGLSAQDGGVPGSLFGQHATEEVRWRGHNPWDLAPNLDGMDVTVRTGDGTEQGVPVDALEVACHDQSVSFHNRMVALGLPHVWEDYGPGRHSYDFWKADLVKTLPTFMAVFDEHRADPAAVSYRGIEPQYDRWGWSVSIDRPALEFSSLDDASADGFSLSGSGTGTVTTPARYVAGAPYQLTLSGASGDVTQTVTADDDGRLTITVPLGTGNLAQQQFTPTGESPLTTLRTTTVSIAAAGTDPVVPEAPTPVILVLGLALVLTVAVSRKRRSAA